MQASRRAPCLALLALAVLAGALLPGSRHAAAADAGLEPDSAQELVNALSVRLLAALERERAALRRDPERVVPLVDELLAPHFDTQYLARLVLGAQWRAATPEERQRVQRALYETLLRTYAGALSEWSAERVRLLPFGGDALAPQALVRTTVTRPGKSDVPVDYHLRRTADGWKIFDVVVDGVSYARTYHDDLDTEISHTGLEATIVRLEQRAVRPARTP